MNEIDIVSHEFSLGRPTATFTSAPTTEMGGGGDSCVAGVCGGDEVEPSYFHLAAITFIVVLAVGAIVYIYMHYMNPTSKHVTFQDKLEQCYGGVCDRGSH